MRVYLTAIALLLSLGVNAETARQPFEYSCEHKPVQTNSPLSDIELQAIKTDHILCKNFFPGDNRGREQIIDAALNDFSSVAKQKTLGAVGGQFPALAPQFDAFALEIVKDKHQSLPSLKAGRVEEQPGRCNVYFSTAPDKIPYSCDDTAACSGLQSGANCYDAFKSLAAAVNIYKQSYTALTAAETLQKLDRMSSDWDAFLAAARSQTLLDIIATSYMERGHLRKDHLVGPPDRTWSLLHPDVVFENLNTAPAGDRAKMGIAIEWFGVNFWRGDNALGIPIGVALASVYADRPHVDAVGHGLMLHFNNKYTLGWTHRDSGNGFYVTIDLLKAIQDNKQALQQYKDQLFSD